MYITCGRLNFAKFGDNGPGSIKYWPQKSTDSFAALNVRYGPPDASINMAGGPYLTFKGAKKLLYFCGP